MSKSILVVEDNPDSMNLFQWTLEDAGYQFIGAESAERCLEILEHQNFDLIVIDISLPGIDGKELTRRLRSDSRYANLPIIAATAHAIKTEELAIRESGITELVTKPIDEEAFLAIIDVLLKE